MSSRVIRVHDAENILGIVVDGVLTTHNMWFDENEWIEEDWPIVLDSSPDDEDAVREELIQILGHTDILWMLKAVRRKLAEG
jgi:hypothetical protein